MILCVCEIGGQAKGWRGGARGRKEGMEKDEGTGAGGSKGTTGREKEQDGPFLQSVDTPFVSLARSNLHTQYAAAVW